MLTLSGCEKIFNFFDNSPQPHCKIACYSYNPLHAGYSIGQGIYVYGTITVPGKVEDHICRPKGYDHADISKEPYFTRLCGDHIKECGHSCWAGGDANNYETSYLPKKK